MSLPLFSWLQSRSAGVLIHPTCLPNDQGIGVLDGAVDQLLDFLHDAGVRHWQLCPLGPTGYGDSPYQCFSSFAGNPYLIDLYPLVQCGLLQQSDLDSVRQLPRDRVDYGWLYITKLPLLLKAFESYAGQRDSVKLPYGDFEGFKATHDEWLTPYSLFLAIKDYYHGAAWWDWPEDVRFFAKAKKNALAQKVSARAEAHAFFQYLFFGQWARVRAKAASLKIEIIGDAPIFVARDSADVWAAPQLFQINAKTGVPLAVAGVPPDYFSADGQLWGNPLYDWAVHAKDGYAWWLARLKANFALYDIVRIDHFRAFDTYWSIPAAAETAKTGEWKKGPGLPFFEAVKKALPSARLIAEDLGELFQSVRDLREATGLPGMTILQFAFGGDAGNLYLPHNLVANSVVYPGTHDNNTTLGWYRSASEKEQDHVRRYLRISGDEIGWDFIRSSYGSTSNLAVIPMQDLFSLGAEARFNTPGEPVGNWQWRYDEQRLHGFHHEGGAAYLHDLAVIYGRA